MPLTSDQQREIMLADHARYMSRQQREDALLSNSDDSRASMDSYECETPLLRGIGIAGTSRPATKHAKRFKPATPRTRAHGAAAMPPDAAAAERLAAGDVESTVLCYNAADPMNFTVRTVADIRSKGKNAKNRAPLAATPRTVDTARFSTGHDFNS